MLGRGDDDDAIDGKRDDGKRRRVDIAFEAGRVGMARQDGGGHARRVPFRKCNGDPLVRDSETHEQRRQPMAGERLAGREGKPAAPQPAEFLKGELGSLGSASTVRASTRKSRPLSLSSNRRPTR